MLHEILLSLSGHPSPLLREDTPGSAGITPSERQLLSTVAHLSAVHVRLMTTTAQMAASHPSAICRAVAAAIDAVHLSAFQRKVLDVEAAILGGNPDFVGAYNIVPLTAVVGEFRQWTRPMDWLWDLVQFMAGGGSSSEAQGPCHAAAVMDRLRRELQSGYGDVEKTAMSLVEVAETAWLRQVSAWILYGRLPSFGADDFFIQQRPSSANTSTNTSSKTASSVNFSSAEFICIPQLLPSFVTARTASSMLFIGKSLNHPQVRALMDSGGRGLHHLSSNLTRLADLSFPLDSAALSRAITAVRRSLSDGVLQTVLPASRVADTLLLLRDFFLLGRGEFAMALAHEADERSRNRWRRADRLAQTHSDDPVAGITVKEGEVAAVLARAWSAMGALQGHHADEEQLELARDLLRLTLIKSSSPFSSVSPSAMIPAPGSGVTQESFSAVLSSPFRSLLLSAPAKLSISLPPPLDMVLSPGDLELYSCVNAYLLSMRRAHIRLTDLWKMSSLRRHHPAPRGAGEDAVDLRRRWGARMATMRSAWTTASAAIFFLAETEAYLQTEVVAGLWEGFHEWLMGSSTNTTNLKTNTKTNINSTKTSTADPNTKPSNDTSVSDDDSDNDSDIWLQDSPDSTDSPQPTTHDPQTISAAHTLYLHTLLYRLLLTQPSYTQPLHALLVHTDHLVTHTRRLHAIFTARDLESDAGVVDAFADLAADEREVTTLLRGVEARVRRGIADVVSALRQLETDVAFAAAWEGERFSSSISAAAGQDASRHWAGDLQGEVGGYAPARVGGINRLLMKLEFGGWLAPSGAS